jgi:ribosome-associated translation inhibitor RaiA
MPIPLQITFRGFDPSDAIDQLVRARVERLERFYDRVTHCHVVIEAPSEHRRKGGNFKVSVKLSVPGGEITIGRDPTKNHAHEDLRVSLRDAFSAAGRKLEDHARVMRGDVKTHGSARILAFE